MKVLPLPDVPTDEIQLADWLELPPHNPSKTPQG